MSKLRNQLMIFACLVIAGQLLIIDYNDLSWTSNAGSYLGIISMFFVIASMILSKRNEKKNFK